MLGLFFASLISANTMLHACTHALYQTHRNTQMQEPMLPKSMVFEPGSVVKVNINSTKYYYSMCGGITSLSLLPISFRKKESKQLVLLFCVLLCQVFLGVHSQIWPLMQLLFLDYHVPKLFSLDKIF